MLGIIYTRAEARIAKVFENSEVRTNCIFLSHRSKDKDNARSVAEYIVKAGINVYLDALDPTLQIADRNKDANSVTQCIQEGIRNSSHILCMVSKATFDADSWWVPYELGFADRDQLEIVVLKLFPALLPELPHYLRTRRCISGITSLNDWLTEIAHTAPTRTTTPLLYEIQGESMRPAVLNNVSHPLKALLG